MATEVKKRCPKCGGPVTQLEHKLFRCDACKMLTDCVDDGDIGYKSPQRYAESKEGFENRQRARQQRRRRW